MQKLLGDEYPAFLQSYTQEVQVGLRFNTLKISPEQFQCLAPFDLTPIAGIPGGYLVRGDEQPGKHPYHAAGLYYLQDPSAMVAAQLLDPQPGEKTLDLSAAPGGKSTQLISLMQDQGFLLANEIDARRVWDLVENLERWGTKNTSISNESPAHLADQLPGFFDRILVDAPCSGEGMFEKSEAARRQWSPALVESCALRQNGILEEAARMLRPGGHLAYVTCTFAPNEDEAVVARFLDNHPEFELIEPSQLAGFSPGRPEWLPGETQSPLQRTVRLWPQHWPGGGQFIALLHNTGDREGHHHPRFHLGNVPKDVQFAFDAFQKETLVDFSLTGPLFLDGNYLYQVAQQLPSLSGLRLTRPGWLLGEVKKGRFEPSHALALGLKKDQCHRTIDLQENDERVAAYLHGEVLEANGENGWVLVCVDGYPLGWGKRVKGVIKNHYPRGLRRL